MLGPLNLLYPRMIAIRISRWMWALQMIDLLPVASDCSPLVSHLFKYLREQEAFTHPYRVLSNSILVGLDLATLLQHQASLPQVQVRTNLILFPLPVPTHFCRGYRSRQMLISSILILINSTSSMPISLVPPSLIPTNSINLIPIRSIRSILLHSIKSILINTIPTNSTSSIPISLIPPNLIPTNSISLIPIRSISSMLLRSISPIPISSISRHPVNLISRHPVNLISRRPISSTSRHPISSIHRHSVHLLRLLHLPQCFSLLELHLRWSWIDTVVQWRIKAVVQWRNFCNEAIWSSDRLVIKQDHKGLSSLVSFDGLFLVIAPPVLHHYSLAYWSFCRLCCIHSWQFHPCPRSGWRKIWLAWNIGTDVPLIIF